MSKRGKDLGKIFLDYLLMIFKTVQFIIESNFYIVGIALEVLNPYIMYFLCIELYKQRGQFEYGGELFVPLLIFLLVGLIKVITRETGRGTGLPIPKERFTEVERSTGEVTTEVDRLQEMLIYMADLEDWLERTGRMKDGGKNKR